MKKNLNILFLLITGMTLLCQTARAEILFSNLQSVEQMLTQNLLIPQAVFVVNTTGDQNDALPGDGVCTDGVGNCSLRGAIQEANAFAGANQIDFNIPGGCFLTIQPATALPAITDSVTIDGYSQPDALPNTAATGSNAQICVAVNGSSIGGFTDGLTVNAANTTIRGLNVRNWTNAGILVGSGNGSIIEGNFLGTDFFGTTAAANRFGVIVLANNVRVGGSTLPSRNILSGNIRFGVTMTEPASGNIVQNNYVGLGANSAALGNGQTGVQMFRSSGNLIGGTTANVRNVVSGNGFAATGGTDGSGVYILGDNISNSPNNVIQGNYIGTNPDGSTAIPNALNGVTIFGGINTTVGGIVAGARNVISGNTQNGVRVEGAGATGNNIQGNYIGLSANGAADLGNSRDGVQILGVAGNTVGGTAAGAGNYISGNNGDGVLLNGGGTTNNFVQGNFIGANAAGTAAIANGYAGIEILVANGNTVGGTATGARNYIAGNASFGIIMVVANSNTVQGNYVGISSSGATLPNFTGIYADGSNNIIGGTANGAGNLISGNPGFGIRLVPFNSLPVTGNVIQGNRVGTNAAGTAAAGNGVGILLQYANANTVGGTIAEARNIVSANATSGISVLNCSSNSVLGNYVGTTLDGTAALNNGTTGMEIVTSDAGATSNNNTIGGTANGAGNLISGNTTSGLRIAGDSNNNLVQGNTIGLNVAGNALPNGTSGVIISDSTANGNVIGGSAANTGNVLSGNGFNGVLISNGASGNSVSGNRIGTNAAGTNARPNIGNGIHILDAPSNTIGGADSSFRNLISGNLAGGVRISGTNATNNLIRANYIGTNAAGNNYLQNAAGTDPTSNLVYGIRLESPNNTVGGANTDFRNVVSGQFIAGAIGIDIFTAAPNTIVQNNYIGTNANGDGPLANGANIVVTGINFTIDSNLISGSFFGINIGAISSGFVTNNQLGTNAAGNALIPNGYSVYLNNSSNIRIGEDSGGSVAPNVIAGGTQKGISVFGNGTGNLFRQNSIYDHAGLGIDLGDDGVTQNDNGDTDTANNLQNYPVLTSVMTTIDGTLNSSPNTSFRIEFYNSPSADSSGYGEGRTFITSTIVNTNSNGNASFSIPNPIAVGGFISSTATNLSSRDTSEFSALKQVLAPTLVRFGGAKATKFADGVLLEWQTGFETNNLGFNVYRETDGKRELITNSLVAGSSLLTQAKLQSGFEYRWFDKHGAAESNYFIEAVDLDGSKETFGAFRTESSSVSRNFSANSPTLPELNKFDNQKTFEVEPLAKLTEKPTAEQISAQNILIKHDGVRLAVKNSGFYRVPAAELFAKGLPNRVEANNLALFADGIEQPLNIVLSENGAFEAVEFYGVGIDSIESDVRNYQLVVINRPGRRIERFDAHGSPSNAESYTATVERRDRTSYFSGLLNGDEENFFGAIVGSGGTDQTLTISNLAGNAQPAELVVKLQGLTDSTHNVRVELNNQFIDRITFAARLKGTLQTSIPANLLREGTNTVRLISGGASDLSLVETIQISFPRKFRAVNNTIRFTAESTQEITVEGFSTETVRVFDVTDANNVFEMNAQIIKNQVVTGDERNNDNQRSFSLAVTPTGVGTRSLLAIADASTVAAVEPNYASNLKNIRGADLVIITKRDFFPTLENLAKLRQGQNLSVMTVDVQDIYDEFNFGQKSTKAVKNFLKSAQENWVRKPQFVIFAGDATYDPKNYLGGTSEIVPTRLIDTLTMETASDEWFGDFNGDDIAEFAIGRLPASNTSEMETIVRKLIAYERQAPINSAAFVSDVSDGFDFAGANSAVREILPSNVNSIDIRRGESSDATVRNNLLGAINNGQKIISYVGHGSSNLWRGNIFTRGDAETLTNANRLPIFVTMTCLNGFFQDPINSSLSEALVKNPNGGAIAVWTATGAGLPDSYGSLNVELHRQILSGTTLGQAHLQAKRAVANRDILQTWILLGDPSMRVR